MSHAGDELVLAAVVHDLASRAKLVAAFIKDPDHRQRMLCCAEELEEEAHRLESQAEVPPAAGPASAAAGQAS